MAEVLARPDQGRIASGATRSRKGRTPESFIEGSRDWYSRVDTNWRTAENYNCRGINQKLVGAVGIERTGKPIRLALSMCCSHRHSPIGTNGTSVKPSRLRCAVQLMQSHNSN